MTCVNVVLNLIIFKYVKIFLVHFIYLILLPHYIIHI
jgi:hypothetical protein